MAARYITNSELQTFKDCRRKWYFSNVLRLTPKRRTTTGPLPLGTRVHGALEVLYDPTSDINPVNRYKQLAIQDTRLWAEQYAELGFDPTDQEKKEYASQLELGLIMVEGYMEWLAESGADAGFEVVSAEEKIDVPFGYVRGREVRLLGKLDVRVRRLLDGACLFIDHKTCGSIDAWLATARINEQFLHYQLLERLYAKETGADALTQGSMVNLLRKVKRTAAAKPPFYHREEVHHSDTELRNYWLRLVGEIDDLLGVEAMLSEGAEVNRVAYPRPSRDCTWKCEFKALCPMLDDGSNYERFIEDHFESYDPMNRYDDKETEV